jgi:ketosteroid isomerase-like protein
VKEVLALVDRLAVAEVRGDPALLDALLAEQFVGVGPLGFVLSRQQWLERFRNGLENRSFSIGDPQVHDHGTAAVVVGVLDQQTVWQGRDNSGRFRITLVAVQMAGGWRLVGIHIGQLREQPLPAPGPENS